MRGGAPTLRVTVNDLCNFFGLIFLFLITLEKRESTVSRAAKKSDLLTLVRAESPCAGICCFCLALKVKKDMRNIMFSDPHLYN